MESDTAAGLVEVKAIHRAGVIGCLLVWGRISADRFYAFDARWPPAA